MENVYRYRVVGYSCDDDGCRSVVDIREFFRSKTPSGTHRKIGKAVDDMLSLRDVTQIWITQPDKDVQSVKPEKISDVVKAVKSVADLKLSSERKVNAPVDPLLDNIIFLTREYLRLEDFIGDRRNEGG